MRVSDNSVKDFYKSRYAKDFAGTHVKYARACKFLKDCNKVLDIGCGDGSFSMLVKDYLTNPELYGVDISEEAVLIALNRGVHAYQVNVDKETLPFENEFFDGVFCGEVIEHLYDPDHLLDEIYRVLRKKGICVLTTPNLASWYNRIFLLLGYQPLFTEVSLRHGVGHPFPFLPFGHIRAFTLRALSELARIHKFKIVSKIGTGINTRLGYGKRWRILAKIANKIFGRPSLSSDIMLVLRK